MLGVSLKVGKLIYKDKCVGYRLFSKEDVNGSVDVYDVGKDIGDTYNLGELSDRNILLIPDGDLLISRDEIDNAYIVKEITTETDILSKLLGVNYTDYINEDLVEDSDNDGCTDNTTNIDFVGSIDVLYDEDIEIDECYVEVDDLEHCDSEDSEDFGIENYVYIEVDYEGGNDDFIDTVDSLYDDEDDYSIEDEETLKIVDYLCNLYLTPSRLTHFKNCVGIPVNLDIEVGNALKKANNGLSLERVKNAIINKMCTVNYDYISSENFCNGMTDGTFIRRI